MYKTMYNKKSITLKYIGYMLVIAALTILDQFTKLLAVDRLKDKEPFVIWDGVFELTYVENRGAAFGMQQGRIAIFVIITFILVPLMLFAIYKIDKLLALKKEVVHRKAIAFLQLDLVILIAGAIGNLIDRLANGFVVDFLYFKLIDFPVFNVADCYVTIATAVFILICFFALSEKELDFIIYPKRKWAVKYKTTIDLEPDNTGREKDIER